MADKFFRKGPHAAKNKIVDVETVPESDERKTVILDEQLDGVEFDDKVWLYWSRNKTSIITTVVLAFAIIIGVQSFKLYKEHSAQTLADAYSAASTPAQLEAFAADNSGTSLAGAAYLQNADAAYSKGDVAAALGLYSKAKKDLSSTVLYGRALLGEALCLYAQDKAKGLSALESVYAQTSIAGAYKEQAGYLLGVAYKSAGKTDAAKKVLAEVAQSPKAGIFGRLAQQTLMTM